MQKYGVVYPNGFCGQWLVWMMQSHPDFSKVKPTDNLIKNFIKGNNKTRHYINAAMWTPDLDYDRIDPGIKSFIEPTFSLPMQFNDFYNLQHQHKTDKTIFRMGPGHAPTCISMIVDYIDNDINYILIVCNRPDHRTILANRIREYSSSKWHTNDSQCGISTSMQSRLKQIQTFSIKAIQDRLSYTSIDIGKLVFDADVKEYKKLCDYTNTEYRVDIFNQFQQEYYNQVWKYIIE